MEKSNIIKRAENELKNYLFYNKLQDKYILDYL
jgi:hypothetical protein